MICNVLENPKHYPTRRIKNGILSKYIPYKHENVSNLMEWKTSAIETSCRTLY